MSEFTPTLLRDPGLDARLRATGEDIVVAAERHGWERQQARIDELLHALEHIRGQIVEAWAGKQYDDSWIRPRLLGQAECDDRIRQVCERIDELLRLRDGGKE